MAFRSSINAMGLGDYAETWGLRGSIRVISFPIREIAVPPGLDAVNAPEPVGDLS
jgi:hypothetical protein